MGTATDRAIASSASPTSWWQRGAPLLFLALALFSDYSGLNLRISAAFFDGVHQTWPWRNAWLTQTVVHHDGKLLVISVAALLLGGVLASWLHPRLRPWRFPATVIFLGVALGPGLVGLLKATSTLACPWDTSNFGGAIPYQHLLAPTLPGAKPGHCFPSGHASGAYAWIVLYFAAKALWPTVRRWFLLPPLLLGSTFALAQEARGAHFLSHDFVAIAICWTLGLLVHWTLSRWKLARMGADQALRRTQNNQTTCAVQLTESRI